MSESLSPSWPGPVRPCTIRYVPLEGYVVSRPDGYVVGAFRSLADAEDAAIVDFDERECAS